MLVSPGARAYDRKKTRPEEATVLDSGQGVGRGRDGPKNTNPPLSPSVGEKRGILRGTGSENLGYYHQAPKRPPMRRCPRSLRRKGNRCISLWMRPGRIICPRPPMWPGPMP